MSGPAKQSDFARRLHAGFEVSPALLDKAVRRALGADVLARERIVRGLVNEVHLVRTSRRSCVVRIDRSGSADFAAEAWAMDQARRAGVPVADVLLVDRLREGDDDHAVMVLSVLPGRPLVDLESRLSPAELREVLLAAGALLATLHSVPAPGVWKPEADGTWNTWDDIKGGFLAERRADREALLSAGLSETEAAQVLELVARCIGEHPWTDPVLCHGDFVPDHLYVDEDLRIRGLIDFGMFHGGPPVSDLAYLRFARPDLDQAAVLAGYGVGETDAEFLLRRRDLHAVTHAVGYLAHSIQVGDVVQAGKQVEVLRGLVRDLRDSG